MWETKEYQSFKNCRPERQLYDQTCSFQIKYAINQPTNQTKNPEKLLKILMPENE